MQTTVQVVQGRSRLWMASEELRRRAAAASRVHVDVGTGDGRLVYRLARMDPQALFIGVDANADALREVSYRASRKPARGGVANALFVRSAVEDLPGPLAGLADRVTVFYPWGSLLQGILGPDPANLHRLAGVGKDGASFEARLNHSAVDPDALDLAALRRLYRTAGFEVEVDGAWIDGDRTTWGARLSPHDRRVLRVRGSIRRS
jgi:16S rRNA (adenine(1408)-N(1))-methyltransferase